MCEFYLLLLLLLLLLLFERLVFAYFKQGGR